MFVILILNMLALQGYGSSDEEGGENDNIETSKSKSEVISDNTSTNSSLIPLPPPGSSLLSLGLQICAAPEVVPTVIYFSHQYFNYNYKLFHIHIACMPYILLLYIFLHFIFIQKSLGVTLFGIKFNLIFRHFLITGCRIMCATYRFYIERSDTQSKIRGIIYTHGGSRKPISNTTATGTQKYSCWICRKGAFFRFSV